MSTKTITIADRVIDVSMMAFSQNAQRVTDLQEVVDYHFNDLKSKIREDDKDQRIPCIIKELCEVFERPQNHDKSVGNLEALLFAVKAYPKPATNRFKLHDMMVKEAEELERRLAAEAKKHRSSVKAPAKATAKAAITAPERQESESESSESESESSDVELQPPAAPVRPEQEPAPMRQKLDGESSESESESSDEECRRRNQRSLGQQRARLSSISSSSSTEQDESNQGGVPMVQDPPEDQGVPAGDDLPMMQDQTEKQDGVAQIFAEANNILDDAQVEDLWQPSPEGDDSGFPDPVNGILLPQDNLNGVTLFQEDEVDETKEERYFLNVYNKLKKDFDDSRQRLAECLITVEPDSDKWQADIKGHLEDLHVKFDDFYKYSFRLEQFQMLHEELDLEDSTFEPIFEFVNNTDNPYETPHSITHDYKFYANIDVLLEKLQSSDPPSSKAKLLHSLWTKRQENIKAAEVSALPMVKVEPIEAYVTYRNKVKITIQEGRKIGSLNDTSSPEGEKGMENILADIEEDRTAYIERIEARFNDLVDAFRQIDFNFRTSPTIGGFPHLSDFPFVIAMDKTRLFEEYCIVLNLIAEMRGFIAPYNWHRTKDAFILTDRTPDNKDHNLNYWQNLLGTELGMLVHNDQQRFKDLEKDPLKSPPTKAIRWLITLYYLGVHFDMDPQHGTHMFISWEVLFKLFHIQKLIGNITFSQQKLNVFVNSISKSDTVQDSKIFLSYKNFGGGIGVVVFSLTSESLKKPPAQQARDEFIDQSELTVHDVLWLEYDKIKKYPGFDKLRVETMKHHFGVKVFKDGDIVPDSQPVKTEDGESQPIPPPRKARTRMSELDRVRGNVPDRDKILKELQERKSQGIWLSTKDMENDRLSDLTTQAQRASPSKKRRRNELDKLLT